MTAQQITNSLFHRITTNSRERSATYRQFCVDAKRLDIIIDGESDTDVSENALYAWVINLCSDEQIGLWFAYWCTQTALADIYHRQLLFLNRDYSNTPVDGFNYHLLDNGRQRVEIDMHRSVLHITKPFRVCRIVSEAYTFEELDRYILHVWVYGTPKLLGTYRVRWVCIEDELVQPLGFPCTQTSSCEEYENAWSPLVYGPLEHLEHDEERERGLREHAWCVVSRSRYKTPSV